MLTTQEYNEGLSSFKIVAARHAEVNMKNIYCVSMAFDGVATESDFVRRNFIAYMNGTIHNVVMTYYNHAAKNVQSQLVLGTSIVKGGNAIFDVGIL